SARPGGSIPTEQTMKIICWLTSQNKKTVAGNGKAPVVKKATDTPAGKAARIEPIALHTKHTSDQSQTGCKSTTSAITHHAAIPHTSPSEQTNKTSSTVSIADEPSPSSNRAKPPKSNGWHSIAVKHWWQSVSSTA